MKIQKFIQKIILIVGLGFAIITANAQAVSPELVCSSGESFANTTLQLDWSIGELVTETFTNSQNIISQGFHQGSFIISDIDENKFDEFLISAFPNPVNDFISLKIENSKIENMRYSLTDFTGKILKNEIIQSDFEQISFLNFSDGTYIITIFQKEKQIKSFKIIKN